MKLMHSYLCVKRHIESSFSNCMGPVKLVQASLGVKIDVEMIFHHCGGPAKLVHTTLSVQRNPKSSFHHFGGRAKLWQGIFLEGKVSRTYQVTRLSRVGPAFSTTDPLTRCVKKKTHSKITR